MSVPAEPNTGTGLDSVSPASRRQAAADAIPPEDSAVWAISWSGGKDSMLALDRAVRAGLEVRYLVTLYDPRSGRVRFHGTPPELLGRQAAALGRELLALAAPWDCFDRVFQDGLDMLSRRGVRGLIFGNIHLADVRAWYEEKVVAHGLRHLEPLWGESPAVLLREVIDRGYVARLVSIDTARLPGSWLGRALDTGCADDLALRPDVDPCGERGEYHTLVTDGPLFSRLLSVRPGTTHADGHFVVLDMELGTDTAKDGPWSTGPAQWNSRQSNVIINQDAR